MRFLPTARRAWSNLVCLTLAAVLGPLLVAASPVPAAGPESAAAPAVTAAPTATATINLALALPAPSAVAPPAAPAAPAVPAPAAPAPIPHENEPGLWLSWAVLDRTDDSVTGSADRATARTNAESSIKAWLAADRLRVDAEARRPLSSADRARIERAVRSSDDNAAEQLYRGLGGSAVLRDLAAVCGVHVRTNRAGYWSYAQITAQDAARTLDCVLDRAPTYPSGAVLVDALHGVDRDGAFGVPAALPPGTPVAVKNGWTAHSGTGLWNVNCVAAWDDRVLAVMTRYPIARGLDYGANVCRDVAADYLARDRSPTGS